MKDGRAGKGPSARISHARVLDALEVRYDHQSARNVLGEALQRADMTGADDYSPEEASRIAWALTEVGPNARPAVTRLLEFAGQAASAGATVDPDDERERLTWN